MQGPAYSQDHHAKRRGGVSASPRSFFQPKMAQEVCASSNTHQCPLDSEKTEQREDRSVSSPCCYACLIQTQPPTELWNSFPGHYKTEVHPQGEPGDSITSKFVSLNTLKSDVFLNVIFEKILCIFFQRRTKRQWRRLQREGKGRVIQMAFCTVESSEESAPPTLKGTSHT